jgi:starch synthase
MADERLRVAFLTKEYPPEIYGGAGVHVEYLGRELAELVDLGVYCFGKPRDEELVVGTYEPWDALPATGAGSVLRVMTQDLRMAADLGGAQLAHSHTWYANFAGYLAKELYQIPHVATAHSLEPLRPWKAEQLGPGYRLSSWIERTAYHDADAIIAVSSAMRDDILACYPGVHPDRVAVVYNGIDPDEFFPDPLTGGPERYGIDPARKSVIFVGRVTRQKGIVHLLDAAAHLDPEAQLIVCAGAPDTPEIGAETHARVKELAAQREGVFWIEEMVPRVELVQMISHATVFLCPSIYEPFGLINVEAMGCGIPVVASAVGGIPEIVVDGETGFLVPFQQSGDAWGTPADPARFARDLADRCNEVLADPERARRMGQAGRQRVLDHFTWRAIARQTLDVYQRVLSGG